MHDGIGLCVRAQAPSKILARLDRAAQPLLAPLAPALVAVLHAGRRAVVAGRQLAVVPRNDGADLARHAVRAQLCKLGLEHKVLVPVGPVELVRSGARHAGPRPARAIYVSQGRRGDVAARHARGPHASGRIAGAPRRRTASTLGGDVARIIPRGPACEQRIPDGTGAALPCWLAIARGPGAAPARRGSLNIRRRLRRRHGPRPARGGRDRAAAAGIPEQAADPAADAAGRIAIAPADRHP